MPRKPIHQKKKRAGKAGPADTGYASISAGFSILKDLFDCPAGKAWDELCREGGRAVLTYQTLWECVLEEQEFIRHPRVGTSLQDFWLERLLDDTNLFHRKAELVPYAAITPSLAREYAGELKDLITRVLKKDWEPLVSRLNASLGLFTPTFQDTQGLPLPSPLTDWMEDRRRIKERVLSGDVLGLTEALADHFFKNGCGMFGRHRAFRWDPEKKVLAGVEAVDPIRLESLVGYDEQRQPLLENIEGFVSGKPANNVLIYGERGTGKSSTVKALLNDYQDRGLRLVEVSPADLMDYHEVLKELRGRRERFILFVDDLSFEENETSYKGLKALLEGTIETTPSNVILIATSNRRHLIREYFAEREEGIHEDGEVHGQDTVEEKLSLSDRFGLVVSFYTPNQETYLKIVDKWALAEKIRMNPRELHARAVLWARQNNGPSGRTARQFINDLKGRT